MLSWVPSLYFFCPGLDFRTALNEKFNFLHFLLYQETAFAAKVMLQGWNIFLAGREADAES